MPKLADTVREASVVRQALLHMLTVPTIYDKAVRYHDLNDGTPAAAERRLTKQDDVHLCVAFQHANEWYPGRDRLIQ